MKISMRKIYILFIFCLPFVHFGQQLPVFTNFILNDYFYNPAVVGSKSSNYLNFSYRNQWAGFEGAPTTLMGSYYGTYRNNPKSGYGISLISDKAGLTQNTGIFLNYAYHLKLTKDIKMGLGIQPGFYQYRIRLYDVQMADLGDDILTGNVLSSNALDINSGFHVYSKKFFVMGSFQQILRKSVGFTSYNSSLRMHYTFVGGYQFDFEKKNFSLQPIVMVNYVKPTPAQLTFMLKGTYKEKFWAGLSYRTSDAVSIILGYKVLDRLNIAYAYDYSISGISKYNSGSHEICFSFITKVKKPSLDDLDEKLNNSIMDDMKNKPRE